LRKARPPRDRYRNSFGEGPRVPLFYFNGPAENNGLGLVRSAKQAQNCG
jgi:hypothetical protein